MKVPLRFRPMKATSIPEETAASMNISTHGVFFATEQKVSKGLLLEVHLKMPREIIGDDVEEWSFTARVAHVDHWAPQTKSPESECSSSTTRSPGFDLETSHSAQFAAGLKTARLINKSISARRHNRQTTSLIGPLQVPTFAALRRHELLRGLRVGHLEIPRSQLSFCPVRDATLPRSKVSVTSPENSKLPPGFTCSPCRHPAIPVRFPASAATFSVVACSCSFWIPG